MESKNSSIDNLVGKLKTGDISKTELFSQLSALYEVDDTKEAVEESTSPPPGEEDKEISSSEKRKKIEDLLENFKASLDSDVIDDEDDTLQDPVNHISQIGSPDNNGELDVDGIQESTERVLKNLKESMNADFNFNPYSEDDTYTNLENQESLESQFRYQNAMPMELTNPMEQSHDRLYRSTTGPRSRGARVKQLEAIMRANEKKECSFKPEIKKLPNMYIQRNGNRTGLVDRLYAWDAKKKQVREVKKVEKTKQELDSCSFKPQLNKTSRMLSSSARQDIRNVSLRSQARAKLVEREIRRQQEQSYLEECTFQPVINQSSRDMVPKNRSLQSYSQRSKKTEQRVLEDAMKECTFAPQTNKVKKHMRAANLYLEMTPFERLSQPVQKYTNDETWPDEYGNYPVDSTRMVNKTRRPIASKDVKPLSPSFLERSKRHLEKRDKTVEEHILRESQELYKPKLNKKSVKMARSKGGFYDRLEKESTRRSLTHSLREQAKNQLEEDCTFSPNINIMSKNLKGRSTQEMSGGDIALKTSKLELARMYARKQELNEVTFKPQRHTKNNYWDNAVESRIKIASEPHSYTERVLEMRARREEVLKRKKAEKERLELEKCTFRPETKEAPEFVRRIADSMKGSKKSTVTSGRPDW
eukprot:CAMPEP_0184491526 /NCGR_PEP_ID=MMETSP0113_2-20130426/20604_1 /TAXON_ID=91329 /ORGANISM="Norrisiella sphaerica, Strain BC52" /LENGTH=644 /DNA_ID=CAMNT_0026875931 /DNA_START=301 /DNA_END=2232 /DNA_ORIENTATION=+